MKDDPIEVSNRALQESEAFLTQSQALAHLGSWEWSIEDNRWVWSDELYRLFEFEPKSVQPTLDTFLRAVHPDDRQRVGQAVQEAAENKPFQVECRVLRATTMASRRYVEIIGDSRLDGDGRTFVADARIGSGYHRSEMGRAVGDAGQGRCRIGEPGEE